VAADTGIFADKGRRRQYFTSVGGRTVADLFAARGQQQECAEKRSPEMQFRHNQAEYLPPRSMK
jgi:hypothetical protein